MDRITKIILGLSGVSLVGILAVPAKRSAVPAPVESDQLFAGAVAAQAVVQNPTEAQVLGAPQELLEQQHSRSEELSFKRDPFAEPVPAPVSEPELESESEPSRRHSRPPRIELTGVSQFGEDRRALVNGRLVSVGDFISDSTQVLRIRRTSIIVLFEGREWTVSLGDSR